MQTIHGGRAGGVASVVVSGITTAELLSTGERERPAILRFSRTFQKGKRMMPTAAEIARRADLLYDVPEFDGSDRQAAAHYRGLYLREKYKATVYETLWESDRRILAAKDDRLAMLERVRRACLIVDPEDDDDEDDGEVDHGDPVAGQPWCPSCRMHCFERVGRSCCCNEPVEMRPVDPIAALEVPPLSEVDPAGESVDYGSMPAVATDITRHDWEEITR